MVDTDDTDELLLIPPDFFAVESDSEHSQIKEPYYNVVNNLIKEVGRLQSRLNSIESCDSFCSNSLNHSFESLQKMENGKHNLKKYSSTNDLYTSQSTQNTPQKPVTKYQINSLPNSPNIEKYSVKPSRGLHSKLSTNRHSPKTGNTFDQDGQVLNEVDTFLSKVKTIQRINAARNLENEFNGHRKIKTDTSPLIDRKEQVKQKPLQPEYELDLLHDHRNEKGDLNIQTSNNNSIRESPNQTRDFLPLDHPHSFSDSSSDSTQITAYNRPKGSEKNELLTHPIHSNALNVLNTHKKLLEDSSRKHKTKETFVEYKLRSKNTIASDHLEAQLSLMNLADIWNANNHTLTKSQLTQKLQEEKYRRQHCEEVIQDLQTRNLQLQQNMSVAIKVDDAKTMTIKKYQESVDKLICKIEKLNKENADKDFEIGQLKNEHVNEKEGVDQKMIYYEKELARVLKVAQATQEKITTLEKRCLELETENHSLSKKKEALENNYRKECEKYKQMSDILAQKELEMNENKIALSSAKTEISQCKQVIEMCQVEFDTMKTEFNKMEKAIDEERSLKIELTKQIADLTNQIDCSKKQQSTLLEELEVSRKQAETIRAELKSYYQGQVELLVQNKLTEFQRQLDDTETKFKEEISKREMNIAKSAASHIQSISEKCSLEIDLLEKKHKEELKLYKIQILQQKQLVESLQKKIDHYQEKRLEIAKQLQKVMESQWNEALRIINNGRDSGTMNETAFTTIDQLNSLKTKSYNNLEDVLSQHDDDQSENGQKRNNKEEIEASIDKVDFHRFAPEHETPVSSRLTPHKVFKGSDFQHFLSLLLNKPHSNFNQDSKEAENVDFSKFPFFQEQEDGARLNQKGQKDRRGPKPPWK